MEPSNPKKVIHLNSKITAEMPVEDQVWFCWQKIQKPLTGILLALAIGFIGYKAFDWFKAKRSTIVQEAYLASCINGERLLFATTYPKETLAGVALMEEALTHQSQNNWEEAAKLYQLAISPLKGSILEGQAQLQYGKCSAALQKKEEAAMAFESVFADSEALEGFRAEAAYERILLAIEAENMQVAKEWMEKLMVMEEAGFWLQKAQMLQIK